MTAHITFDKTSDKVAQRDEDAFLGRARFVLGGGST